VAVAQDKEKAAADAAKVERTQIERDIEKFWGKRRKVAVIQKRVFDEKAGRFELTVQFGVIPNDPFVNYLPVGLRGTHHFLEWIGLEFGFLYALSFDSGLKDGIGGIGTPQGTQLRVTLLERQKLLTHLGVQFSIIHGKVAVMKTGLSHFDLFLAVGPSFHLVEKPVDSAGAEQSGVTPFRVGGYAGGGFKFFINEFFGVRLDVRQYFFPKSSEAGGGLHKPTEISLGATFFAG
jgi:outer membrane beta-barrel protein